MGFFKRLNKEDLNYEILLFILVFKSAKMGNKIL